MRDDTEEKTEADESLPLPAEREPLPPVPQLAPDWLSRGQGLSLVS